MPRKTITEEIIELAMEFTPKDDSNAKYLRSRLEAMSDAEFTKYMAELESGEEIIPLTVPNFTKKGLDLDRNKKIAKKHGIELMQRVWYTDPLTGVRSLSRGTAMITILPVRVQSQLLSEKDSIPLTNTRIDESSGQVTGDSKGSRISYPELGSLLSEDLQISALELVKVRGGDRRALAEMEREIISTGTAKLGPLMQMGTRAKSADMISAYLDGMHFDNTF